MDTSKIMIPYEIARNGNSDLFIEKQKELDLIDSELRIKSLKQIENYSALFKKVGQKVHSHKTEDKYFSLDASSYVGYDHFYREKGKWNEALYIQQLANEIVELSGQIAELISQKDQVAYEIKKMGRDE